jgi:hypothetical protein
MRFPKRFSPVLFAFFLTMLMVFVVTGVTTALNVGFPADFVRRWFEAWLIAWAVAFPTAVFVAPWTRRLVDRLTAPAEPEDGERLTKTLKNR